MKTNSLNRRFVNVKVALRRLLMVCLLAGTAQAAGLNDTGITSCGDTSTDIADCATVGADGGAYPRQDATQGRDAAATAGQLLKVGGGRAGFDFTKIANDGRDLSVSAALGSGPTDWACTRDNVTGLTWEIKTLSSGLRSLANSYSWYNSDSSSNGGKVGVANGGRCFTERCDTEKFVQDVNAIGLCGSSAWRMPTAKELEGVADLGIQNIDTTYFATNIGWINISWSGTPYAGSPTASWAYDSSKRVAIVLSRNSPVSVVLVYGGQ